MRRQCIAAPKWHQLEFSCKLLHRYKNRAPTIFVSIHCTDITCIETTKRSCPYRALPTQIAYYLTWTTTNKTLQQCFSRSYLLMPPQPTRGIFPCSQKPQMCQLKIKLHCNSKLPTRFCKASVLTKKESSMLSKVTPVSCRHTAC